MSLQSVLSRKMLLADGTFMFSLLDMNRQVMPLKVCLPSKLLVASFYGTLEGVDTVLIVRFHMCPEIVASVEKLSTSLGRAFVVVAFFCCYDLLANLPDRQFTVTSAASDISRKGRWPTFVIRRPHFTSRAGKQS